MEERVNSLPDDKILDWYQLETIVRKGEIACIC